MQERYRRERESAYETGRAEYATRAADPTFRDFVTLFIAGRTWRSEHGVLTVWCHDTLLRARMQAWMDELRAEWLTLTGPGA